MHRVAYLRTQYKSRETSAAIVQSNQSFASKSDAIVWTHVKMLTGYPRSAQMWNSCLFLKQHGENWVPKLLSAELILELTSSFVLIFHQEEICLKGSSFWHNRIWWQWSILKARLHHCWLVIGHIGCVFDGDWDFGVFSNCNLSPLVLECSAYTSERKQSGEQLHHRRPVHKAPSNKAHSFPNSSPASEASFVKLYGCATVCQCFV